MKTTQLLGVFLLFFSAICWTSCSDDDHSIALSTDYGLIFEDEQTLTITPFYSPIPITIEGGNRDYQVKSSNNSVITIEQESGTGFLIHPVDIGQASITVEDEKRQLFTLFIHVEYATRDYRVKNHFVVIEGEHLTEEEKEEITTEILTFMIPAKPGGKYQLIFDKENDKEGSVKLFPSDAQVLHEGTFKIEKPEGFELFYRLTIDLKNAYIDYPLVFDVGPLQTRTSLIGPIMFRQDLLNTYKERYPALEKLQAIQEVHQEVFIDNNK